MRTVLWPAQATSGPASRRPSHSAAGDVTIRPAPGYRGRTRDGTDDPTPPLAAVRARGVPGARAAPTSSPWRRPGAGKTTFALAAARQHLGEHPRRRLVVVAPTQHLKTQWADAAEALDLHLEPSWSAADGRLPADVHGMVTTYQQVAASTGALAPLARDAFVVLDEAHHSGEERAWGDSVRAAFAGSAVRLSLSGTPFRSDTRAIPFVRYDDDGLAQADVEYGYGDALLGRRRGAPGALPAHRRPDGVDRRRRHLRHGLASRTPSTRSPPPSGCAPRCRWTASGCPTCSRRAHERLLDVRRSHPGGRRDGDRHRPGPRPRHRRAAAAPGRRRRRRSSCPRTPARPTRIAAFARGTGPWIVAVRMLSEGVDIPRLRVGVFATTTTTELFFRQAVGRLVRWTRGPRPAAEPHVHPRRSPPARRTRSRSPSSGATACAATTDGGRARRSWRTRRASSAPEPPTTSSRCSPPSRPWPVGAAADHRPRASAAARRRVGARRPRRTCSWSSPRRRRWPCRPPAGAGEEARPCARASAAVACATPTPSLVRHISRITGLSHSQVNAELNRRIGIERIGEATIEQLERRRDQAARWLAAA